MPSTCLNALMHLIPFPPSAFQTASLVCGLSIRCGAGEAALLRDLRESVRRVLPRQRPLLRVGWLILLTIRSQQQASIPQTRHQAREPCAAVRGSESER